jgi:hypothetical protein
MAETPNITFICCVESGPLEDQTVRMIESLRRWGGRVANAPVTAVTPRVGPGLARHTRQALDRLNARYIRCARKSGYSWFVFLNKPQALIVGEEACTTETVCWLDSDLLIVGEPDQLFLSASEDFTACASDQEMATTGPDNPFHPLWEQHCKTLGLNIEDLPWIVTESDKKRIRLYWNGGLFVYRRSTGFANHYLQTCLGLLESRITSAAPGYSLGIDEMSAIGLAMIQHGLRWRPLPDSHNHPVCSQGHEERYNAAQFQAARIIHYHDAMWPHFWPTFMRCLRGAHPEVAAWLEQLGPMKNAAPLSSRVWTKLLAYYRGNQASAYHRTCRVL